MMTTVKVPEKSIWIDQDKPTIIKIIDQRELPYKNVVKELKTLDDAVDAIKDMAVRGAPLIGVTAAYGMYLATLEWASSEAATSIVDIESAAEKLMAARPTAVNLAWAVNRVKSKMLGAMNSDAMVKIALQEAHAIAHKDVEDCSSLGQHGFQLLKKLKKEDCDKLNILTHCNAGRLSCISYGTATAPIYVAHQQGIPLHVYVNETRPRGQGARLTAWELAQEGVPHTLIADTAAGYYMSQGKVDVVIAGADRVAKNGDTANKIGTYMNALAARDNNIPFYIALELSTFDSGSEKGADIPIEYRQPEEVLEVRGLMGDEVHTVRIAGSQTKAENPAFDITPARLITGYITEKGIFNSIEELLAAS